MGVRQVPSHLYTLWSQRSTMSGSTMRSFWVYLCCPTSLAEGCRELTVITHSLQHTQQIHNCISVRLQTSSPKITEFQPTYSFHTSTISFIPLNTFLGAPFIDPLMTDPCTIHASPQCSHQLRSCSTTSLDREPVCSDCRNFAPGSQIEVLGLLAPVQNARSTACFKPSD